MRLFLTTALATFDATEMDFLLTALDTKDKPRTIKAQPLSRKQCCVESCTRIAQSKGFCKAHGGGKRCKYPACGRPCKARGLCQAHGGVIACKYPACTKGSQKRGLCASHGGVDKCIFSGCSNIARVSKLCTKHTQPLNAASGSADNVTDVLTVTSDL